MSVGGTPVVKLEPTATPHVSDWESDELATPEALNTYTVVATDAAGNEANSTITVEVLDP